MNKIREKLADTYDDIINALRDRIITKMLETLEEGVYKWDGVVNVGNDMVEIHEIRVDKTTNDVTFIVEESLWDEGTYSMRETLLINDCLDVLRQMQPIENNDDTTL